MQTATEAIAVSNKSSLAGRILSGLAAAFLLFDGVMKLFAPPVVREAFVRLGYPETKIIGTGVPLIVCTIIYLIPRASIFGAILLTGYLGGAICTHVRVNDPLFSHVLIPSVYRSAAVGWPLSSRAAAARIHSTEKLKQALGLWKLFCTRVLGVALTDQP